MGKKSFDKSEKTKKQSVPSGRSISKSPKSTTTLEIQKLKSNNTYKTRSRQNNNNNIKESDKQDNSNLDFQHVSIPPELQEKTKPHLGTEFPQNQSLMTQTISMNTQSTSATLSFSTHNVNFSRQSFLDHSSSTLFQGMNAAVSQQSAENTHSKDETISREDFECLMLNFSSNHNTQRRKRLKIQKLTFATEKDTKEIRASPSTQKRKVTKKQLQKFIAQDFSVEMEGIFANIQESIKAYNFKIPSNPNYHKKPLTTQLFHTLTFKKRSLLISNIIKLGTYFHYQRIIVHSAISLFDTLFLQPNYQIKEKNLQLYAITALFICAKREDSSKQSLSKYIEFAVQYSAQDFVNSELAILKLLKWQINPISLESVNAVVIQLLENKYFRGCGYMKDNPIFIFRLNVLVDLINMRQNLTNFQFCIKNISLALIYVTVTLTQNCFASLEQAQIELTENIFLLGQLSSVSSCNSTTFSKINELFSQFMKKFFYLNSISDVALEVQYVARFLEFFNDSTIYSSTKKNLHIQTDYINSLEFIQSSKYL